MYYLTSSFHSHLQFTIPLHYTSTLDEKCVTNLVLVIQTSKPQTQNLNTGVFASQTHAVHHCAIVATSEGENKTRSHISWETTSLKTGDNSE